MRLATTTGILVLTVIAGQLPAAGQTVGTATGSIVGTARDATGAVLAGVEVAVSGPALMQTRRTTTDAAGKYRIVVLPPGDHTLSFSLAGFTPLEQAVRVGLNFTATVDVTLPLARQREEVAVAARSSVLDRHSAAAAETFDSRQLADLPNSRSVPGLLSATHALSVPNIEVGGSNGLFSGTYSAYGRNSSPRHTMEGIVVTGLFGFGFTLDYGSFEEASVLTGAHGAEWPTAGIHTQFVTKSGANRYKATLFAGYENRRLQSFNVDDDQIGRVAPAGGGLSARDANRLWDYRDVNADVGGFLIPDRLWWYGSVRQQEIASRLVNFPPRPHETALASAGGKLTLRVTDGNTITAYGQRTRNHQPYRLDPFGPAGSDLSNNTAINETIDSTADQRNVGWVWKGEWNSVVNDTLIFEVRAGQFGSDERLTPRSAAPRFEDIDTLLVTGGNRDSQGAARRNQLFGSLSHFRNGGFGSHHFKLGGEAIRFLVTEMSFGGFPGNVLHVLSSGQASSVYLFEPPTFSQAGVWSYGGYASDSWRVRDRLTLNIGLRFDRYRLFLPAQEHPSGSPTAQRFDAVDNVVDWNVFVPRVAAVYDVTGQGRTLAKLSYSRYRGAPNAGVAFNANPNSGEWWSQHEWIDGDGNGIWNPGEQGRRLRRRGGVAVESLDPDLQLPVLDEAGAWIERELPGVVGVRTGVVWRHERQHFARQNARQPFDAFTVPVSIRDPGPDGIAGTVDDGQTFVAYDLDPSIIGPAINIVRNVPGSSSEYWTWELEATRRAGGRFSFGAGYTHTWNDDQAAGYLQQPVRNGTYPVTPNDFINTGDGGRHEFTTWTAKAHGTFIAPWDVRVSSVLRHQSGQPFGRTFKTNTSQLRYASTVTVLAEPVGAQRMDNVTLVDLRIEKRVQLMDGHNVAGFVDLFNAFNANPEQNMVWSSGASYRRPLSIVSPRIVMAGLKFDW